MTLRRMCGCFLALCLLSLLGGCTLETTAVSGAQPGAALRGSVHGGQQPVSQSHIYLMAATVSGVGSAGYGLASTSLLSGTGYSDSVGGYVLSAADGSFSLDSVSGSTTTYDYTCPTPTTQVYLYALGGNPGAGGNNSAAGFLAALGNCGGLSSSTYINLNEVTTVAAAYALSGYAADATHISIPQYAQGTTLDTLAQTGLQNAFLNAAQLVSSADGTAQTKTPGSTAGSYGVPDYAQIYTLANILAACINTNGATTNPSNCYTLFSNATSGGGGAGTVPSDTATAAINIAHHPYVSSTVMTNLYGLQAAIAAPFAGVSNQPNDFTVGIKYTNSTQKGWYGIAIDASGNAWISNGSSVTELSSTGVPAPGAPFTATGMGQSQQIAIDSSGSVWVANFSGNDLVKFSPSGGTGSGVTGGQTITNPTTVAIDVSGDIWTNNTASTSKVVELTSSGSGGYTGASYTAGLDTSDLITQLAFDASSTLWVGEYPHAYAELDVSPPTTSPVTYINGLGLPNGMALDAGGSLWFTFGEPDTNGLYGVLKVTDPGGSATQTEYTGGALSNPNATPAQIAIDGAGDAWIADLGFTEFNNAGTALSPITDYTGGQVSQPVAIAVDGSGDVWVTNSGSIASVTELIGAATPVVTPIVSNLVSPYSAPASRP